MTCYEGETGVERVINPFAWHWLDTNLTKGQSVALIWPERDRPKSSNVCIVRDICQP